MLSNRRNRFVPSVSSLEDRKLLTNFEIANFGRQMVLDPSDSTSDTAYGLIGMNVLVNVQIPSTSPTPGRTYEGMWGLKITTSDGLSDPKYSTTVGRTGHHGTIVNDISWKSNDVQVLGPKSYMTTSTLGKDEGDVTIKVEANVKWTDKGIPGFKPPSSGFETMTDTLTIHVEAPNIINFHVGNMINPEGDAPGMGFHLSNSDGTDFESPENAESYMFSMSAGDPKFMSAAGFWSTVYNDTHYDIQMGFIQQVDIYNKRVFSTGKSDIVSSSGSYVLDAKTNGSMYMYNFQVFIPSFTTRKVPSATRTGPSGITVPNTAIHDSPSFGSSFGNEIDGWLQHLEMQMNFKTNIVVTKAYLPNATFTQNSWAGAGEGVVNGSVFMINPIALSTAEWHMYGKATLSGNTDRDSTVNGNWNIVIDIGPGKYTEGNSNTPWKAFGDNVVKYIEWNSNMEIISQDIAVNGARRLKVGMTRKEVISILGKPEAVGGTSRKYKTPSVYKYGEYQMFFLPWQKGMLTRVSRYDKLGNIIETILE